MYMVMQRYATAIRLAYEGHPDVEGLLIRTREARAWLETLDLPSELMAGLVEPLVAVEEAFRGILISRDAAV